MFTGLGDVPGTTAAVLYDYVSEERDELSIVAGEVLELLCRSARGRAFRLWQVAICTHTCAWNSTQHVLLSPPEQPASVLRGVSCARRLAYFS